MKITSEHIQGLFSFIAKENPNKSLEDILKMVSKTIAKVKNEQKRSN